MKITQKTMAVAILTIFLSLFLLPPVASAAAATEVILNQATLNAAAPYWVNGTTAAAAYADNWNAYFDASSATLTLRNAQINQRTVFSVYPDHYSLLRANGDLTIVFEGSSGLTDNTAATLSTHLAGVYVSGNLTVRGSGALCFTYCGDAFAYALYCEEDLRWFSGSFSSVCTSYFSCGPNARGDMLIAGGDITVQCEGQQLRGVTADSGAFRMTGGSVQCRLTSTAYSAYALHADTVALTGGNAFFQATGTNECNGIRYYTGTADITGGCFTFVGEGSAICCADEALPPEKPSPGMYIFVSETVDGSGLQRWYSSADGLLGSIERYAPYTLTPSPFHYVRIYMPAPQTGDGQSPLLWAGIALLCAAGAAMAVVKRKRTNTDDCTRYGG